MVVPEPFLWDVIDWFPDEEAETVTATAYLRAFQTPAMGKHIKVM